tara:strand:- start:197 stop:379 length:183 start_codon:yes stop_codon:yes gene_type:complete
MSKHIKAAVSISLLIILSSTLAGCTSETEPLGEDEIGELSVVLTLDFVDQGNQTTNLAED